MKVLILLQLDFYSLEVESLERELRLDDARGLDPGPQHVLLGGHVVGGGDAVETKERRATLRNFNFPDESIHQKANRCHSPRTCSGRMLPSR